MANYVLNKSGSQIDNILQNAELIDNKKTAWQSTPTDMAYPSEKLVKDTIDNLDAGDISYDSSETHADGTLGAKLDSILGTTGSVTGNPVVIDSDVDGLPMKTLKVKIEPKQDFNGYDYPWPAGGGKNKLSCTAEKVTTMGVATFTVNDDGSVLVTATGAAASNINFHYNTNSIKSFGGYILNGCPEGGTSSKYRIEYYDETDQASYYDYGSGLTIPAAADGHTCRVVIGIRNGYTVPSGGLLFKPMIRETSVTDATYEPYSNICPIEGWDSVEVKRDHGKNRAKLSASIIGNNQKSTATYSDSGVKLDATGTYGRMGWLIPVSKGMTYTLRFKAVCSNDSGMNSKIYTGSADGVWSTTSTGYISMSQITSIEKYYSVTFTAPSNKLFFGIYVTAEGTSGSITVSELQVEHGSTATAYESYVGGIDTYPISFSSAGTVYGGELDVKTGELVVNKAIVDMGTLTWSRPAVDAGRERMYTGSLASIAVGAVSSEVADLYCEKYRTVSNNDTYSGVPCSISMGATGNIYIKDDSYTDAAVFKTAMSGVQLVYTLAAPLTYTLTPAEVKLLLGKNYIYTDAASVEAEAESMSAVISNAVTSNAELDAVLGKNSDATGNPAEVYSTIDNSPLKSLKVKLEPKQNLHGYDMPWAGGAGKNLFDKDNMSSAWVNSNLALTTQSHGYSCTVSASAGETFTASSENVTAANTFSILLAFLDASNNVLNRTVTSLGPKFLTATAPENTAKCLAGFWDPTEIGFSYPQLEKSPVATSWEPYENICPIEGYTSIDVSRTGKNLINGKFANGYHNDAGKWFASDNYRTALVKVKPLTNYTTSFFTADGTRVHWLVCLELDKNKNIISSYLQTGTILTGSNTEWLYIRNFLAEESYVTADNFVYQIEEGEAYSEMSPYAELVSIELPSDAGTVYGGELDVTTGELVVTHTIVPSNRITLNNISYVNSYSNGLTKFYQYVGTEYNTNNKGISCNYLSIREDNMFGNLEANEMSSNSSYPESVVISMPSSVVGTTQSSIYTYLHDTNPPTFLAKLATPITYSLTPTEVKALLGKNYIYSNGTLVEAEPETVFSVASSTIANLEQNNSDLDAVLGKSDAVVGNPIEIDSDVDGISLKSLKVNIEPTQDLHGYDSPWPAGRKNLMPLVLSDIQARNYAQTWSGNSYTLNGVTFTVNQDSDGNVTGIKVTGTASANTTFYLTDHLDSTNFNGKILNGCPSSGSGSTYALRVGMGNGSWLNGQTETGSGVTINTQSYTTVTFAITIYANYAIASSGLTFYPMVRLATDTDTTFEPYTNVCSINGKSSVNVVRTGKNLIDGVDLIYKKYVSSALNELTSEVEFSSTDYISIPIGSSLVFETAFVSQTTNAVSIAYYDKNKNAITRLTLATYSKVNPPVGNLVTVVPSVENAAFIRINVDYSRYAEIKAVYSNSNYSKSAIFLPSSAGTVYGGTLDATNGKLTVAMASTTISDLTTSDILYSSNTKTFYTATGLVTTPGIKVKDYLETFVGYSSRFKPYPGSSVIAWANATENYVGYAASGSNNAQSVRFSIIGKTAVDQDVLDMINGTQVVYELATPLEYTLSPTEVKLLLGKNYLYTDADTIQVECGYIDSVNHGVNKKIDKVLTDTTTLEGTSVVITDGTENMPVKNLTLTMEPHQDLHGYDHPWPAGGGKNLLEIVLSANNTDFTVENDNGVLTVNGTNNTSSLISIGISRGIVGGSDLTAGNYYYTAGCVNQGSNTTYDIGLWDSTDSKYPTNWDGTAVVRGSYSSDFKECKIEDGHRYIMFLHIRENYTASNLVFRPMLCLGTETDTSWAPYSNVCPITGTTSVEVKRTGINRFDPTTYETFDLTGTGTLRYGHSFGPGTYTIIYKNSGMIYYRTPKADLSDRGTTANVAANTPVTVTVSSDCVLWVFNTQTTQTVFDNIYVNVGEDTSVIPYTGATIPITFPSSAGTVYSGTLDVTNGKLTVDKAGVDLGTLTSWTIDTSKQRVYKIISSLKPNTSTSTIPDILCNRFVAMKPNDITDLHYQGISLSTSSALMLHIDGLTDDENTTSSDVETYFANNPTYIVAPLATPLTYTLTPEELTLLQGYNYISTDADNMTVEYGAYLTSIANKIERDIDRETAKAEEEHLTRLNVCAFNGKNLKDVFGTAEALHNAVAAGDFSKIHIGDYWPITLNGTFKDFAYYTVPTGTTLYTNSSLTNENSSPSTSSAKGTLYSTSAVVVNYYDFNPSTHQTITYTYYVKKSDCEPGYNTSINCTVKMEVAGINTYLDHGEADAWSSLYSITANHLVLCSRDCLPPTLAMQPHNAIWFDNSVYHPWVGSSMYHTLNDSTSGIILLVQNTELGGFISPTSMQARFGSVVSGTTTYTGSHVYDRGILFLPTEREVFGSAIFATNEYEGIDLYNQWPIFSSSTAHINKGIGDGGNKCRWMLQNPVITESVISSFSAVSPGGIATYSSSSVGGRIPLCFLLI